MRRLFASVVPPESFSVTGFGNLLASTAFLYGLSPDELTRVELDLHDPFFPVVYGVRAVKPTLPAGDMPTGSATIDRWTSRALAPSAAILMYHRIATSSAGVPSLRLPTLEFRAHLEHLRAGGYRVMSLQDIAKLDPEAPGRAVAITFDDGYAEVLTDVVPLLEEFGMPATVFIVGDARGRDRVLVGRGVSGVFRQSFPARPLAAGGAIARPRSFDGDP